MGRAKVFKKFALMCYFCLNETDRKLCDQCFSTALKAVQEHYEMTDIQTMSNLARENEDCLTVVYSTSEHCENKDMSDARFVIYDFDMILDECKYFRDECTSTDWVDLSTGTHSQFWDRALKSTC